MESGEQNVGEHCFSQCMENINVLAKFVNFKFKESPVDHTEGQHCWLSCCNMHIAQK